MNDKKKILSDEELELVTGGTDAENLELFSKFSQPAIEYQRCIKLIAAGAFNVSEDKVDIKFNYGDEKNVYKVDGKSYTHREFVDKMSEYWH